MAAANGVAAGGARKKPDANAAPAPKREIKMPRENTAARQSPKETRSAVGNAFGPVQQKHTKVDSKDAGNSAKSPSSSGDAREPADNPKTPADSAKEPAVGAKEPADGAKAPADPKATPQTDARPVPFTDAKGQAVKTPDNRSVILDKRGNPIPVESDGKPMTDPKGNTYAVDDTGKYLETGDGKYVVYERASGNPVATDPATGETVKDANGNPFVIDKQGAYLKTPEGNFVVYDRNLNTVAIGPDGEVLADKFGDPYMVLSDGKYAKAGENDVVYSKRYNNQPVAVDPANDSIATDTFDHPLAVGKDGNFLKTPDGKDVVYDVKTDSKRTIIDPATGKTAADANGNPYAVSPDGSYTQTADGNPVVYDKARANNLVAVDSKTGEPIADARGRPLGVDEYGNIIKTPEGNAVVYETINNKVSLIATDQNGDPILINGNPAAVDQNGNFIKAADGNSIVYDAKGNPVAQDKDGKTVTDEYGNARVLDRRGDYLPGAVYEKSTGFRTLEGKDGGVMRDAWGNLAAADENGRLIEDDVTGMPAVYDTRGKVVKFVGKTADGLPVYQDRQTGDLVSMSANGPVYKIDDATQDLAKDADGNPLPALYDPVNSDPTRPPVMPNGDVQTTLDNLPQGIERGDPMMIREELFDENSNLDVGKLTEAASRYDARDVYDALVNSGEAGGWDKLVTDLPDGARLVHPDAAQAREAIAALIAWQNANGKYNPMRKGEVPPVVYYQGGRGGAGSSNYAAYVNADAQSEGIASRTFHELNHARVSQVFQEIYNDAVPRGTNRYAPTFEAITEYLANDWTGDKRGGRFDQQHQQALKELENAVVKMGNGDRNSGMDILKRAYFAGDAVAIRKLMQVFPPGPEHVSDADE